MTVLKTSRPRTTHGFDDLFTQSVSITLKEVLGENAGNALMYHIGIGMNNPIRDPRTLSTNLQRVVGGGSLVLEKLVVKSLYREVGIQFDESEASSFEESIGKARSQFAKIGEESG